jgi:hypothetical protein
MVEATFKPKLISKQLRSTTNARSKTKNYYERQNEKTMSYIDNTTD